MEVKWIDHNGKKVLLVDYSGIKLENEMINHLNKAPKFLKEASTFPILILTDITGSYATSGFMEAARKMEKELLSKLQIRQAILGVTGSKSVLLKGFNLLSKNKLVPFTDKIEALNYLTKN